MPIRRAPKAEPGSLRRWYQALPRRVPGSYELAVVIRTVLEEAKLSLVEESAEPVARRRFTLSPGRRDASRRICVAGVSSPAGSRRFRTPKPIRVPEAGVSER